jgi:hypothetical protein
VTISKKGIYISSGAHFSGLPEYTSPIIYGSPLIEKKAEYSKKCAAVEIYFFPKVYFFISSHAELSCNSEYARSMMHHSFLIRKRSQYSQKITNTYFTQQGRKQISCD